MDFEVQATATLNAPPEAMFERITNIAQLPQWNAEIPEVHEAPSVVEPGVQWVVEIKAMGTHWRSRSEAVEVDATRGVFRYRSVSDDGNPSFADWRWELAPVDGGKRSASLFTLPLTRARSGKSTSVKPATPVVRRAMQSSLVALKTSVHNSMSKEKN